MSFSVRELEPGGKLLAQIRLDLLARVAPLSQIRAVFHELALETGRTRKLCLELTVWLVIAMSLYADLSLEAVLAKLLHGLRLLCPDDAERLALLPGKSAVCYRRYQLGVRPLRRLFHRTCRPLATPETRGAFLGGLRLMAIDGHTQDVPDTPENAAVFHRPTSDRGDGGYPQVLCVCLAECGTHAVVDACFWPWGTHESRGARRLLRSVTPEMLVMVDRGLHSYDCCVAIRQRDAHVLSRISAKVQPQDLVRLPDGSYRAQLFPSHKRGHPRGAPLTVRLIEYTLDDPQRPRGGTRYRLVTTLLDWEQFPADTLARTYHERWEIELVIDEQETHQLGQHHPAKPLRSRKPAGVIQELYGVLLAHYLVRLLMHEAALAVDVDPDRLSFTHALRVLQDALPDLEIVAAELRPQLCRRLLQDLAHRPLPERRARVQPRVVKCKILPWPLKRAEHRRWPPPTRPFAESIVLI